MGILVMPWTRFCVEHCILCLAIVSNAITHAGAIGQVISHRDEGGMGGINGIGI